jgi:hypothetical protein
LILRLTKEDDVDVIDDGDALRIVRVEGDTRGQRLVRDMRGKATTTVSTDELMELFRGE